MQRRSLWICVLIVPLLAGCAGLQSALNPASPQADGLKNLIVDFTILLGIIWIVVMVAVGMSLRRRRRELEAPDTFATATDHPAERSIGGLAIATGVVVVVLTGISFVSQHKVAAQTDAAVHIKLTGHQWWWQVQYADPEPSQQFETANEIHLPVGRPVTVDLDSQDVIHSFWLPNLAGKRDLIPGRPAAISFVPTRKGVFRAQCAEFCGLQHAHMALTVTVEDPDAFASWRNHQLESAPDPQGDAARHGREIFMKKACVMCHAIQGTEAASHVGPDLTHLASRDTIAAATLPLTRGSLAAWISDPQGIKPGAQMPIVALDPDELNALLSYLMDLK